MRRVLLGGGPAGAMGPGVRPREVRFRLALSLILLVGVAVLTAAKPLRAQSTSGLVGRVQDVTDGSLVPSARVRLAPLALETMTDFRGEFRFGHLPPGRYAVSVEADGYEDQEATGVEVWEDVSTRLTISVRRRLVEIDGSTVRGNRLDPLESQTVVVSRQEIESRQPRGLADLLQTVPGVEVEDVGGHETTVRLRGSPAEHVMVLLDGQRLSPSGSGAADLSGIPVDQVERIEVIPTVASAVYGEALSGAVNIVTQPSSGSGDREAVAHQRLGSFGASEGTASFGFPLGGRAMTNRLAVNTRRSDGDFEYVYTSSPGDTVLTGRRANNSLKSQGLLLGGRWTDRRAGVLGYTVNIHDGEQRLPGAAREPNLTAFREDYRLLGSINWSLPLLPTLSLHTRTGYTRLKQRYCDPQEFDTRFVDETTTGRAELRANPMTGADWRLGGELQRQGLDHCDRVDPSEGSGLTERLTRSAFAGVSQRILLAPLSATLAVDLATRYDWSRTAPMDTVPQYPWDPARQTVFHERWSPGVGLVLSRHGVVDVRLHAAWGSAFRLPSLNALFWKGDARSTGNPDLRPEHSTATEGGIRLQWRRDWLSVEGGTTLFHRYVDDLLVWVQSGPDGIWKPVNLNRTRHTGHDDYVTISLWKNRLELRFTNAVVHARNRVDGHNLYDKTLTYTPEYTTSFELTGKWRGLSLAYSIREVGRRYATDANTRWYDAYRLDDFAAIWKFPITDRWLVTCDYRLNNLRNEDYVLITHYPMPGRSHEVGVKASFQP